MTINKKYLMTINKNNKFYYKTKIKFYNLLQKLKFILQYLYLYFYVLDVYFLENIINYKNNIKLSNRRIIRLNKIKKKIKRIE